MRLMRREDFAAAPVTIKQCYDDGLSKDSFPVLLTSTGVKYIYYPSGRL